MSDLIGKTIGAYEIVEQLGQGGMAQVYKAYHPHLNLYRALKIIRPELVRDDQFQARFVREAQTAASMRHPNIIQVHDFGMEDGLYFMVMEYVEGEDLNQLLKRERVIRPFSRILEILVPLVDALSYAHSKGVVHRDLKPANIMINTDGQVILTDFGIAKLTSTSGTNKLTQTGSVLGTPAYMAPEQMKTSDGGPAADIYSLGVILYELVTGHLPFEADTPWGLMAKVMSDPVPPAREFNPDVSAGLEEMLRKAMAKAPEERYQTLASFSAEAENGIRSSQEIVLANPDATRVYKTDDGQLVTHPHEAEDTVAITQPSADVDKTELMPVTAERPSWFWPAVVGGIAVLLVGGWFLFGGGNAGDEATPPESAAVAAVIEPEATATATLEPTATAEPTATVTMVVEPTETAEPIAGPTATLQPPQFPDTGFTGDGVTVVVMSSGIDWRHPDFLKEDGTTRIKYILDMSNQSRWCRNSRPAPIEYTEEQINEALANGTDLATMDFHGAGTATAGMAAGNGSAIDGRFYAGVAPNADIIVVKANSKGAEANDVRPSEDAFTACFDDGLRWVDEKITELGQPAVGFWNYGSQYGPIDGTSAVSRQIDTVFGADRPGRVWVAAAGWEGHLLNHAGGTISASNPAEVRFNKFAEGWGDFYLWYSGNGNVSVSLRLSDGRTVGPIMAGRKIEDDNGVWIYHYNPDDVFYPWQSTNGDQSALMVVDGYTGEGAIILETDSSEEVIFDLYTDISQDEESSSVFLNYLVDGRLSDLASTYSAITVGSYVLGNEFVDMNGDRQIPYGTSGEIGRLSEETPAGPTRDGRTGIDLVAQGDNSFAAVAQNSRWGGFLSAQPANGEGWYTWRSESGAAAAIVMGTIAQMLEANPDLTGGEVKAILQETALADEFTGEVPNLSWGYGKLDIEAAVSEAAAR